MTMTPDRHTAPPLDALAWMVLNEADASADRLPDLFGADPAMARAELRDVIAAVDWLEACGVDVAPHRGLMLNDDWTARILATDDRPPHRVSFQGQAWIGGHATDVDDSYWEYEVTAAELEAARPSHLDNLRAAARAPQEVRDWAGPFRIEAKG